MSDKTIIVFNTKSFYHVMSMIFIDWRENLKVGIST
jgi:hypothetical protein